MSTNYIAIRSLTWCMAAVVAMLAVAAPAYANLINFDELADGTVVTNQYAAQDITFSSANGEQMLVTTQPQYQSTPPNFICTGTSAIDCTGTVIFSFSTPSTTSSLTPSGIKMRSGRLLLKPTYTRTES
jgi:hypothetical protein